MNRIEEMNLLLCRKQDVLILREQPDAAYLSELRRLGFEVPRILTVQAADFYTPISELVLKDEAILQALCELALERRSVFFMPYAVTNLEEEIANACGLTLIGPPSNLAAKINDKIFNKKMAEELGFPTCKGVVCETFEELREQYPVLKSFGKKIIIKEPYSASGKGLYVLETDEQWGALLTRLSRFAHRRPEHPWIMEQWLEKTADVNVQIFVDLDGTVDVFSIKRQILNGTVYMGSQMPPDLEHDVIESFLGYGRAIGSYLHNLGYRGIAGIDSIITEDGVIIPLIEINGRFTLSTYLSFISYVLGDNKKVYSRYFRVCTSLQIDYSILKKRLEDDKLLYHPETGEGVIIYTAGSLPYVAIGGENRFMGRVFALVVAKDWAEVETLAVLLDRTVNGLTEMIEVTNHSN
ncbi:preATP grasp domain-containing protein [Paenibacillus puerhi]|uniref:preATP grasp domain-containing protein n=1 Tax=Paenibacillus puerhi TaxID=2692622 RepID=UPI001F4632D9|nr:peptide ligase PGM1-related protein [Paenibacillus puerhi]